MKLFLSEFSEAHVEKSFRILPDSSLLRNNEDFYIPNFSNTISATACFVVKISKLGKCFAPRFSERYYCDYTLGVNFIAVSDKHSPDVCVGFDKSLAIGSFIPSSSVLPEKLFFSVNGDVCEITLSNANTCIDNILSSVSQFFTLKIGDLAIFTLQELSSCVAIGDLISSKFGAESDLITHIK